MVKLKEDWIIQVISRKHLDIRKKVGLLEESMKKYQRIPTHIGIIPDGNRRWAQQNGFEKKDGYQHGIDPGVVLVEQMIECGVKEVTFYGFTKDNCKREMAQREAFTKACIQAVESVSHKNANIYVAGNTSAKSFPKELLPYAKERVAFGEGTINVNFLVNYDWKWDLDHFTENKKLATSLIPRMDMIIRWGGRRRLSGFLPVQSVYSDFYIIEDYWPDFKSSHFEKAMRWYQDCDVTLGG